MHKISILHLFRKIKCSSGLARWRCVVWPCPAPQQRSLNWLLTQLHFELFSCVCVRDHGSEGHVSGCGLGARGGVWVSVSMCMRQTGRATIHVHDWVHDSPAKLSYWRHPQRVCVLGVCVCACVCVCWCVLVCVKGSHAQVPAAGETEDPRPDTGWTVPKPSYRRDPHCIYTRFSH